ncbi:hypothetical protein L0F63_007094 [Massospora cicadina]|nr:hypothetical protein L0F63_007094 [Massospora cicadina]
MKYTVELYCMFALANAVIGAPTYTTNASQGDVGYARPKVGYARPSATKPSVTPPSVSKSPEINYARPGNPIDSTSAAKAKTPDAKSSEGETAPVQDGGSVSEPIGIIGGAEGLDEPKVRSEKFGKYDASNVFEERLDGNAAKGSSFDSKLKPQQPLKDDTNAESTNTGHSSPSALKPKTSGSKVDVVDVSHPGTGRRKELYVDNEEDDFEEITDDEELDDNNLPFNEEDAPIAPNLPASGKSADKYAKPGDSMDSINSAGTNPSLQAKVHSNGESNKPNESKVDYARPGASICGTNGGKGGLNFGMSGALRIGDMDFANMDVGGRMFGSEGLASVHGKAGMMNDKLARTGGGANFLSNQGLASGCVDGGALGGKGNEMVHGGATAAVLDKGDMAKGSAHAGALGDTLAQGVGAKFLPDNSGLASVNSKTKVGDTRAKMDASALTRGKLFNFGGRFSAK